MANIAVLGAGSWGTALALHLARNNHFVKLWGHRQEHIKQLIEAKENYKYLPGYPLPANIHLFDDLSMALKECDVILVVVPSFSFKNIIIDVKKYVTSQPIIWAIKGFEPKTGDLLSSVFEDVLPKYPYAFLAGPSFAKEVASGKPTAVTIVGRKEYFPEKIAQYFHSENFICYIGHDLIGAQIGGGVKNVIAIATGIADGLNCGANTRAALITRGLHEMTKLAVAMGGEKETLSGLTGLGDLVLTATDDLSRNRRFGLALGAGMSTEQAKLNIGQVIEGEGASFDTWQLAKKFNVRMPITEQVYKVLYEGRPISVAMAELNKRALKIESF